MPRSRLIVAVALLLLWPTGSASAGESCAMLQGTCRDRCAAGETAEQGDFMDCGEKQDCCVHAAPALPARCCVVTAAPESGRPRCSDAVQGTCPSGAPSPLPCSSLPVCR